MNWTSLVWMLLYFAVGWIFTEVYQMDNDIWKLLFFLGWPIPVGIVLVVLILLALFTLALAVEEIGYGLFRRRKDEL